ncbi:mechanosensitive ion channel protein MscS [bacterium SM23_31]|nr:MAG: mechanosensitive ion channel protein MscS [bacterium SM23_31]
MEKIYDWVQNVTGLSSEVQNKIYISILIIAVLWLIRSITYKIVCNKTENAQIRYRWQKSLTYFSVIIGILLVGRVWFTGMQFLATYLGLLSAGIAIALKDLIVSMAAWIFLIWRRPFSVGDRIQIGKYMGDVIDLRIFKFTLLEIGNWVDADQSTGRIMHIPNLMVLTETIANYSKGFQYIWNEISVLITFESNWQKAKDILKKIGIRHAEHLSASAEKKLKEVSKKYMIFYSTLTPTVYTTVKDCGVQLTIRYLIEPRSRRASEQSIWEDILVEFAACSDIDFAYPTQRFYNNALEGKEGTRIQ